MPHPMGPSNVLNACVIESAVSELLPVAAAVLSAASSLWSVMERRWAGVD